jgi:uncharacterized protein (TIGR02145 family)
MRHLKTNWLQHFILLYIILVLLITCEEAPPEPPEGKSSKIIFSTISSDTVSYRFAFITCRIDSTGGNYISQHGFSWGTFPKADLSSNKTELGKLDNPKSFSDSLAPLLPNKKYYVRAYAKTNNLIVYSNELNFTTLDEHDTLTDSRDDKKYNIIRIGNLWWMAENLNFYTSSDSWCYNDSLIYAETYGRLYTWEIANNVCPAGWHLPSDSEWKELEMYLGMTQAQADNIGWRGSEQGTQLITGGNTDFEALCAGFRFYNGIYYDLGTFAYYWSSTDIDSDIAWCRFLSKETNQGVNRTGFLKNSGLSVRCVKDPVK